MREDDLSLPYKLGFVTITAALIFAGSDVNASYLPSKYYKASPVTKIEHSWVNITAEDYLVTTDLMDESLFNTFTSNVGLYDLTWLNKAKDIDRVGKSDEALDIVYDNIDKMLSNNNFIGVDSLLSEIDINEYSVDMLLGLLTSTLPAKNKLENRKYLLELATENVLNAGVYGVEIFVGLD